MIYLLIIKNNCYFYFYFYFYKHFQDVSTVNNIVK